MIKIEFTTAIAIFLTGVLFIVFGQWLFYTVIRKGRRNKPHVWQCPFCAGIYTEVFSTSIFKCPRCGSLLDGSEDMLQGNYKETEDETSDEI